MGRWCAILRRNGRDVCCNVLLLPFAGALQVSNTADLVTSEDNSLHKGAIMCLKWNADGTRLVSADKVRDCYAVLLSFAACGA